ncbi:hypothetical protein F66182_455 [Fusarium sp. NRRL 66182]|nr:hypothetical protein F66182_455 [Fusarium sp. NRRL 66182]
MLSLRRRGENKSEDNNNNNNSRRLSKRLQSIKSNVTSGLRTSKRESELSKEEPQKQADIEEEVDYDPVPLPIAQRYATTLNHPSSLSPQPHTGTPNYLESPHAPNATSLDPESQRVHTMQGPGPQQDNREPSQFESLYDEASALKSESELETNEVQTRSPLPSDTTSQQRPPGPLHELSAEEPRKEPQEVPANTEPSSATEAQESGDLINGPRGQDEQGVAELTTLSQPVRSTEEELRDKNNGFLPYPGVADQRAESVYPTHPAGALVPMEQARAGALGAWPQPERQQRTNHVPPTIPPRSGPRRKDLASSHASQKDESIQREHDDSNLASTMPNSEVRRVDSRSDTLKRESQDEQEVQTESSTENNDEWPIVHKEYHIEHTQRQNPSFLNKLGMNGSSNKKHSQTLHKSSAQSATLDDWSRRLKIFQKENKIPKNSYHDQLSTVLQWSTDERRFLKTTIIQNDKDLRQKSITIRNQDGDITKLKLRLDQQERQIHEWNRDWNKAEEGRKRAEEGLAYWKTHANSIKDTLSDARSKLQEGDQNYKRAIDDRNLAQQDAAFHERQYLAADADLQNAKTAYAAMTEERDRFRRDCSKYWDEAQQRDGDLKTAVHSLSQAVHDLGTMTAERDEYKKSSEHAHHKYIDLEKWHRNEMVRVRTEYDQHLQIIQDAAKTTQDDLEARISTMAETHDSEKMALETQHAQEIAHRDQEAGKMENKYRTKLKSETSRLQMQVNTLKTHMASYSNIDSYRQIPDDQLRTNFLSLAQRINNLINWVPRPSTYSFGPDLDPDDFLGRTAQQGGRSWPKFIRHVCWRIIIRGFFDRQLGFGAFGRQGTEGFEVLDHVYQLFAAPDSQDSRASSAIFPNTKEMNVWRAALFEALLKMVRQGAATNNTYIRLFRTNLQHVADDLVSSLDQLSGSCLDSRASDEIAAFVEAMGTLVLEMASQRAHVYLDTCIDGGRAGTERLKDETDFGSRGVAVDLMIQPCLRRVGDGWNDLRTERVIVKGDFVSQNNA